MAIEFRLLDSAGNETKPLPDVESFSISPILCDAGAIEFQYPADGINFDAIQGRDEFGLAIYVDGVRQSQLDALIKDVDGDDISDDAVWKFTGFFNNGRLAEAVVYPKGWPNVDPLDTKPTFTTATAGTIVGTFMQQATARGTLAGITYGSFSSTTDSNGVAWNKTISLEYTPQQDYLEVLANLYDLGMCEFQMVGMDLRLYVPGTLSVDRTTQATPLVFRKGRDMDDSPRKISSRGLGTVVLAAGSEGLYVERKNDTKIAGRRRIESGVSSGNVNDTGTLTTYADTELTRRVDAKMEKTQGLLFTDPASPRPLKDFNVGDWAWSDSGMGLEKLRIKQWVLKLDAAGKLTGSVVLNDLFAERDDALAKRVQGIVGGTTITGASTATDNVPADLVDGLAPAAPTGLTLTSAAYMDDQGHTFGQASASWVQVTTNADGTICDDLQGYRVAWRYKDEASSMTRYLDIPQGTTAFWSPLTPGRIVWVWVQSYDRAGNYSAWSAQQNVTIVGDTVAPEAPSSPSVDNYLGLIRILWDGKSASNAAWPADFDHVEVHVSTTNDFVPDITTRKDILTGAGPSFYEGTYGVTYYAKLVAFDRTGNQSPYSGQGLGTSSQVVSADVFDGAIGSAKLADLAVTTAKIADLAVNNAKIGSLDVGKLTAGVLNAQVTISGRVATALTGKRVELNSIGIQAWDASGNQSISLDGVNNLLAGKYVTAFTGRRIEIGSAGKQGRIDFLAAGGANGFIQAYTESDGSTEAIQIGMQVPNVTNSLWNRININQSVKGEYAIWKSGTLEFTFDIGDVQIGLDGVTPNSGRFVVYDTFNRGTGAGHQRLLLDKTNFWIGDANGKGRLRIGGTDTIQLWDLNGNNRLSIDDWTSFYGQNQTVQPRFEMRHSDGYIVHGTNINGVFQEFLSNGHVKFFTDNGWAEILPLGGGSSVGFKFFNPAGYGGLLKFFTAGGADPQRIEARWGGDDGFYALWAQAFVVNSAAATKSDIEDAPGRMLDHVKSAKVKQYRRHRPASGTDGKKARKGLTLGDTPTELGELEVGLLAHEAPDIIRAGADGEKYENIDLYQMAATLWGAVQELSTEIDDLKKGGKK